MLHDLPAISAYGYAKHLEVLCRNNEG